MQNIQSIADKAAISLSFICTIHCLALPLLAVLLPTMTALNLEGEAFHLWLLITVIPTSMLALTMGCRKHNNYKVMLLGVAGVSVLIAAAGLGHSILGENGEKIVTLSGASLTAVAHLLNHRLCKKSRCECHS